eukprot:3231983-Rhodomonas_salina.1
MEVPRDHNKCDCDCDVTRRAAYIGGVAEEDEKPEVVEIRRGHAEELRQQRPQLRPTHLSG